MLNPIYNPEGASLEGLEGVSLSVKQGWDRQRNLVLQEVIRYLLVRYSTCFAFFAFGGRLPTRLGGRGSEGRLNCRLLGTNFLEMLLRVGQEYIFKTI